MKVKCWFCGYVEDTKFLDLFLDDIGTECYYCPECGEENQTGRI